MKHKARLLLVAALGIGLAGYAGRGFVRDVWDEYRSPRLPEATPYQFSSGQNSGVGSLGEVTNPFETGYSTSEHYVLETAPTPKPPRQDPLAFIGTLPTEKNLDVPFTSQAPLSSWDAPYQEACEEASVIMVDAYYRGETGRIPPDQADAAILKLVAYAKTALGLGEDADAEQMARLVKDYYGYEEVIIKPLTKADDIKEVIALGYPVIIPAAGKLLGNPNFLNGGPAYHMVVVRGYTPTMFITNDPGTRKGEEYVYDYATLLSAARNWTGSKETILQGEPVMMVVLPTKKP